MSAWLEEPVNHIVTLADAGTPASSCKYPIRRRYSMWGRVELLNRPALAIVGSRNATAQGIANAESLARTLSDAGLTIVSGLALGIDTAASRRAGRQREQRCSRRDRPRYHRYPACNRALAHELAECGVLVSEFILGTPAIPATFPRRNRLISGLALGCRW